MTIFRDSDIAAMEKYFRINLINSLPGYKSLNMLGSVSPEGVTNLALVSSAFHLGSNPPLIGLIMRPQRPENDTLHNIRSTGQYTLNNVLPDWYEKAHQTSATYPSGVSEFEACGFEPLYIQELKAPFVKQSSIKMGLHLREMIDIKLNGTTLVIGEVVALLVDEPLIEQDGFINHHQAGTVTVAGLDAYYLTQPLQRMAYAKPDKEPKALSTHS
ncbi:flavin reductase [Siphonobacter sp. SORGH_AS_0500]|uniref:flavin reductase family protein n=1 Tax=Siphonobacter sp. SORGH_AS_0500 TaxID=1864824 RepID=UPI0028552E84|nr:flavin reductase [Siphonobacter sp. SORGH_AS_0500]MDR6194766.1 flavin reductase (DIM6/NTAB) family NADH-FMN oxidoreductase RutF [Siphonobacter sp. SORGH_AS_0500]